MTGFAGRENQLFDILQTFKEKDLEFVVVGGYAVSAFQHRFSVDADVLITGKDLDRFAKILRKEGYERMEDRDLETGRFVSYRKEADLPVTVDLMVGGIQSRRTDASWSYREIAQHSERVEIQGSERAISVRIPEREALIAMKLHSGRLTDARDVVALAEDVDFERIESHLRRGEQEKMVTVLNRLVEAVESDDFADAFKGVFTRKETPREQIDAVVSFLHDQIDDLSTSD